MFLPLLYIIHWTFCLFLLFRLDISTLAAQRHIHRPLHSTRLICESTPCWQGSLERVVGSTEHLLGERGPWDGIWNVSHVWCAPFWAEGSSTLSHGNMSKIRVLYENSIYMYYSCSVLFLSQKGDHTLILQLGNLGGLGSARISHCVYSWVAWVAHFRRDAQIKKHTHNTKIILWILPLSRHLFLVSMNALAIHIYACVSLAYMYISCSFQSRCLCSESALLTLWSINSLNHRSFF